ncbi:MAG: RluA family pseudouridine synthase [Pseudomonadota bacterium]
MTQDPDDALISEFGTEDHAFDVETTAAGARLDAYISKALDGFSRSRIKDLIKQGNVTLDNVPLTSPNHRLKGGERIVFKLPPVEDPVPKGEAISLSIAYEDSDLIVVDKPADMVVHPAVGNWTGTLVNALIHHCGSSLSGIGGVRRPGIVHRLDKETSGLLVVAKNDRAHQGLAAQFADHGRSGPLRRAYSAFLWNAPPRMKGTVETEIGRSSSNRVKMAVVRSGGRIAITHYETKERFGQSNKAETPIASQVTCTLETGRTHQIRVHMAHIGAPLIGDPVYGTGYMSKADTLPDPANKVVSALNRQALHAGHLAFEHPLTGEILSFDSPLPHDLETLRNVLRGL